MPHNFNGRDSAPVEGRVGIVISRYNDTITNRLLQGALETLSAAGLSDVRVTGEELLANWFGWTNRTLEATAAGSTQRFAKIEYAS